MSRIFFFCFGLLIGQIWSYAQSIPTEPDAFLRHASNNLKSVGTEAYNKAAYDFETAWNSGISSDQKEKIIEIAQSMARRAYNQGLNWRYFFSYIAFAVEHANVKGDRLSQLLQLNENALASLTRPEYAKFLFGLNAFFNNQFLYLEPHHFIVMTDGTWDMEFIGEIVKEEEKKEEIDEYELLQQQITDTENADPWATNFGADPWSNDTWSNDAWGGNWDGTLSAEGDYDPNQRSMSKGTFFSFAGAAKARYSHPPLIGPMFSLQNAVIDLVVGKQILSLKEVNAHFLLQNQKIVGQKATFNWPTNDPLLINARIDLGNFTIKAPTPFFENPNATFSCPGLIEGKTEGVLVFKANRSGNIITFTSFSPDVSLVMDEGKVHYFGGIQVAGNKLSGKSVDRDKGELTLIDDKGRTVVFRGQLFEFNDQIITSPDATVSILHDYDSIHHPGVSMRYDRTTRKLYFERTKKQSAAPFYSNFFQMAIQADAFQWDMQTDSVHIMLTNARNLLPATFESLDYFTYTRYTRLTGPYGFHPVSLAVYYSRKYNSLTFFDAELVSEFKIDPKMAAGAMKMLDQNHLASYNPTNGLVTLYDRAFHYYDANAGKKDFDNLMIPSVISSNPNATWHLDSGKMVIRGVEKFHMTTNFKIIGYPENKTVTLMQNRMLQFDGEVEAIDFDYHGKNFLFDYDAFLVNMPQIDSIQLVLRSHHSNDPIDDDQDLANNLQGTSGTLYLNRPDNKSGKLKVTNYPYFISESEAIVYFDRKEVLNGAYDKSVKFIIPPIEVDSLDRPDVSSITFPGVFNSGGIFPDFEDVLHVMPDKSLGFVHEIPAEGYPLYGTPARTYETITLSNNGIQGLGQIDFLNTTIFSKNFTYYPDSVTANGTGGLIRPGSIGSASFPQAELGQYRMYWLPRKDSMYLATTGAPFKFYNGTALLTGAANITQKGVYGFGTMITRGSKAISKEFEFKELTYGARHAKFEVLTNDPQRPAMAGDDIRLSFDLIQNIATVNPERQGVPAISFPYAAMKTSITNAVWYLEDSIITMTKPDNVPITSSYFYSTRKELDSLAFNATKATYNIKDFSMLVEGIPFIEVADAKLTPEGQKTVVRANSELEVFRNATMTFEYPSVKHSLKNGTIRVESRKEFSGKATYLLPIMKDTFEIEIGGFLQDERTTSKTSKSFYTMGTGGIEANRNIFIAPGFQYKGEVIFKAYKQALELKGFVKPRLTSIPGHNVWIAYQRVEDETNIIFDLDKARGENGETIMAGLHYGVDKNIYPTFIENYRTTGDQDFFRASGNLTFNERNRSFEIEHPVKAKGERYAGQTFYYNDSTMALTFEGKNNFISPANKISIVSAVIGTGNRKENSYALDGMLVIDFKLAPTLMSKMALDMLDVVTSLGNPPANNIEIETLVKMANISGEEATRRYEANSLKSYVPLSTVSPEFLKPLVITSVKMKWSNERKGWYNTSNIGVSNIGREDINALMDGFLEFTKDDTGNDVMNLFLQAAPDSWYYFNYQENSLLVYSSNRSFNQEVKEKSNFGKSRPGDLVLIAGDENETLKFINGFRKNYFNIDEAYKLTYPDEGSVDDEKFNTIQKKDDGFGF